MREIEFRGKRVDGNNNWVYGNFLTNGNDCFIINKNNLSIGYNKTIGNTSVQVVSSETLGQYTGLTDKNGVKIYEGDKVLLDLNNLGYKETRVLYREDVATFVFDTPKEVYAMIEECIKPCHLEVIGNIHD